MEYFERHALEFSLLLVSREKEDRDAYDESFKARQMTEASITKHDKMKDQVEMGADDMVRELQKQIDEQTAVR